MMYDMYGRMRGKTISPVLFGGSRLLCQHKGFYQRETAGFTPKVMLGPENKQALPKIITLSFLTVK